MGSSRAVTFVSALVLTAQCVITPAQNAAAPPANEEPRTAHLAWGSDPAKRCPELRQSVAEQGAVAVVQFMVGSTGVTSHASIRSSSGSAPFDAAAMSCVLKLRFQAATRFGDGVAVESWQQTSLKWEGPVSAPQAAHCEPGGSSVVMTDAQGGNTTNRQQPGPALTRTGVCVCVDETGNVAQAPVLTSSSGIAGFDKAALDLSSAARYRPASSPSGQPAAGCFRFNVGIEVK
ncbi:MAG: TonB family protein [Gammaproteobacteria bacterium]|nr:TonB family protein [Gammaproteobacteria bacterium]